MTEINHWQDDQCARAFWDQHQALPYQELLDDTVRWLDPKPGEHWLDLGCGGGQLTAALWKKSQGQIGQVTAVDLAAANALPIAKLRAKLGAGADQVRFQVGNLSDGLGAFASGSVDGIVSGLAISYAESQDPATGEYTDFAYNRLLAELQRVLKPGGRVVFSVNVPDPKFSRIFWKSLGLAFRASKPVRLLVNGFKMHFYGRWLKKEARRGRFHFFHFAEILARLQRVGFQDVRCRLSYAEQAYVVSARKPAAAAEAA